MTLVVEDGTGLSEANSFVTLAEANSWLEPLLDPVWEPLDDETKERHLIHGARYVSNGQIYYYSGGKQTVVQSLAWPRHGGVYRNGGPVVPDSTIPTEIKLGQIAAALASANGALPTAIGSPAAVPATREVQSERVGDLAVTYFDPLRTIAKGDTRTPLGLDALADLGLPAVTGIVAPLLDEDFYQSQSPDQMRVAPMVGPGWNGCTPQVFWVGQFDEPGSFPLYMSGYYGLHYHGPHGHW